MTTTDSRHVLPDNGPCPCCLGDPDTVCDACGAHFCWAGMFMCDRAMTAGVVQRKDYVGEPHEDQR